MRKILFTIIMSFSFLTDILAQDAIYVFRNDGEFNAYLTEDIDSILFITLPADSTGAPIYPNDSTMAYSPRMEAYDNTAAVQVVYTPDEVIYIPMNAVENISFKAPPAQFADNVVRMEQDMWKHLTKVEGKRLTFAATLPSGMVPAKGKILLCTDTDCYHFTEGFVGKVTAVSGTASTGYTVDCESVMNIDEVFKQLIAVERVTTNDIGAKAGIKRVEGNWELDKKEISLGLENKFDMDKGSVAIGGSLEGTVLGTVVYNITTKTQTVELKLKHDWQTKAYIDAEVGDDFEKVSEGKSFLTHYFPWWCPVFKFDLSGHLFVHGEGNAHMYSEITSPKHSYLTTLKYENGEFKCKNEDKTKKAGNTPGNFTQVDLNGKIHAGGMLRASVGTIECFDSYAKLVAELYLGPKISGNFYIDTNQLTTPGYYDMEQIKDSKITLSLLAADVKAYGKAKLFEEDDDNAGELEFFNAEIDKIIGKDYYFFPEFSNYKLNVEEIPNTEPKKYTATVSSIPKRDLVMPLNLGYAIFSADTLMAKVYDPMPYNGQKNYTVTGSFSDEIKEGIQCDVVPIINFMEYDMPASPYEGFYLMISNVCPDNNHPHMTDLGLPGGMKWSCCNVNASKPEEYGGYYAWAETIEKDRYSWDNYAHFTPPVQEPGQPPIKVTYETEIKQDIEGTEYDAAHVLWGDGWRMPTDSEFQILDENCTWEWTTYKGTKGMMVTGKNGNHVFLPAAGYIGSEGSANTGVYGHYRIGTFAYKYAGANKIYRFNQDEYSQSIHSFGQFDSASGASVRAVKK